MSLVFFSFNSVFFFFFFFNDTATTEIYTLSLHDALPISGEVVVVTQFGDPVRVETTPGLKLKYPSPVQSVTRLDRRLFVLVPPPREFLTLGKKSIVASGFIVWRIADPRRFMQTVFDRSGAESRLGDILFAELGAALGGAPFSAFVSI